MGTEDFEDTKLHEAVRLGDLEQTRIALKEGYNPNQIGIYQWSSLHEASNNGDVDIVDYLLQFDGDPNKADLLCGSTAVHYAASQGHTECLELLLTAGGRYDVVNNDEQSSLDVATGTCRILLQKQRDEKNHISPPTRDVLLENILADTRPQDNNNVSHDNQTNKYSSPGHHDNQTEPDVTEISSGFGDVDSLSLGTSICVDSPDSLSQAFSWHSNSSSSSRPNSRAWSSEGIVGNKKEPVLGHIKMSFEFNAKKATFKVRVWQVLDLLLPPPDKSMISSIYVKSYLQPDKKKQTKRKTEEVRIDSVVHKNTTSTSAIFKPVTFNFSKGLEYEGISQTVINQKFIEIEVCITQRYTRKSFVVATWNMPLSMAARKLRKEKYPLKPSISSKLPENMTVYNGSSMNRSGVVTGDSSSTSSLDSWAIPYLPSEVVVERSSSAQASSIEVSIGEEDEDEAGLQHALQQITVMEQREQHGESLEMTCKSLPGSMEGGLDSVSVDSGRVTEVQIHITEEDDTSFADAQPSPKHSLINTKETQPSTNTSRARPSPKDFLGYDYSAKTTGVQPPPQDSVGLYSSNKSRRAKLTTNNNTKGAQPTSKNSLGYEQSTCSKDPPTIVSEKDAFKTPMDSTGLHRSKESKKGPSKRSKGSNKGTSGRSSRSRKTRHISSHRGHDPDQVSITQPDTLCWDDLEEPMSFSYVPLEFEDDVPPGFHGNTGHVSFHGTAGHSNPVLPMATGFVLPDVHHSFSRQESKDKSSQSELKVTSRKISKKKLFVNDEENSIGLQTFETDSSTKPPSLLEKNSQKSPSLLGKDRIIDSKSMEGRLERSVHNSTELDEESSIGTKISSSSTLVQIDYTTEPKPKITLPSNRRRQVMEKQSKYDMPSVHLSRTSSTAAATTLGNKDLNLDHMTKSTEGLVKIDLCESAAKQDVHNISSDDEWEEAV